MKKVWIAVALLFLVLTVTPASRVFAGHGTPPWGNGGQPSSPPPTWRYNGGRSEDPGYWPGGGNPQFAQIWQVAPSGLHIGGMTGSFGGHRVFAPTVRNNWHPAFLGGPRTAPVQPPAPQTPPQQQPVQCTPRYAGPSLYVDAHPYNPPHPVVIGQDPLKAGVDVTFKASGGRKTNDCPRGDAQKALTSFRVLEIRLSEKSREWILNDLGRVYPGAYIKGQYPLPFTVKSKNLGFNGSLTIHFDPPDPGFYEIKVEVTQSDGQRTVKWFSVPVYLLETELIH